jgi:hypothetical protein
VTDKEKAFAVHWLRIAADHYGDHVCNDMEFPRAWTRDDCEDFVRRYHDWNGDAEEFRATWLHLPDYAAMAFLAHLLEQEIEGA